MIKVNCNYRIKDDIKLITEDVEKTSILDLANQTQISRNTINEIMTDHKISNDIYEKFYSYFYKKNYRFNSVKEEILKEKFNNILFHGSKYGLSAIDLTLSRDNCDFGKGFYLGEAYNQALSFICENKGSSVYSFKYSLDNLKVKKFDCNLEWMLSICFYRGKLKSFDLNKQIQDIIKEIENADVIIAPIADNKMFYIMNQFTEGEINADVALHSLSASKLGLQYVFKTDKALNNLVPVERYYISNPERDDCIKQLIERSYEIDTKLKIAKREFRNGLFIEELLK